MCLLSLFIHPGEMRRKFYYTRSQDTPKWLRTMFDKCMEELSSDFPAGCKNELEIESSTKIGTCQKPSKLTVVCTNNSCQSTCRSVLFNVHLKPGRFLKIFTCVLQLLIFSEHAMCLVQLACVCCFSRPFMFSLLQCGFLSVTSPSATTDLMPKSMLCS